jgi:hypothetical protein
VEVRELEKGVMWGSGTGKAGHVDAVGAADHGDYAVG